MNYCETIWGDFAVVEDTLEVSLEYNEVDSSFTLLVNSCF